MEITLSSEPKDVKTALYEVVSCDAAMFAVKEFVKFAHSQKDRALGADIYRPFLKEIQEIIEGK